jgi:hypothetical protein
MLTPEPHYRKYRLSKRRLFLNIKIFIKNPVENLIVHAIDKCSHGCSITAPYSVANQTPTVMDSTLASPIIRMAVR